jgi:hypothetical protein
VYGKGTVDFQKNIPFAEELFRLAHKMQLDSLADEAANFIGRLEFNASVMLSWYDLFAQMGNAVGLNLFSKSKVCVLRSCDFFKFEFIISFSLSIWPKSCLCFDMNVKICLTC